MASGAAATPEEDDYASFLKSQSWKIQSDAPMISSRNDCAAVAVDGRIIAIGGAHGVFVLTGAESSVVQMHKHPEEEACTIKLSPWSTLPATKLARQCFGAAVVPPHFGGSDGSDPNIVIAGGYSPSLGECAETEILDFSTDSWRMLPSLNVKRGGCAVASSLHRKASGGAIYVVGGKDRGEHLGSVEYMSFSAQHAVEGTEDERHFSWKFLPTDMKQPRRDCAAVVVEGQSLHPTADASRTTAHQLVVLGGFNNNGRTNTVEAYDFQTGQWYDLPPMNKAKNACAAVAVGQCIFVMGGFDGRERLATVEYFDFSTRKWTLLPQMSKRRGGCAAVLVDGHIVVLGGHDGSGYLNCVESLRVAVDDTALHRIDLADLPPTTEEMNRIQPLEEWCGTVKEMLAKVEADIDKRMDFLETVKEDRIDAAKEKFRKEVKAVKEEHDAIVESLKSSTDDWVKETRRRLGVTMDEIRALQDALTEAKTTPPHLQVFIRDAQGDRVPLLFPPGDYDALKRLAAAELNVSPDVIVKFRRPSDGAVLKGDRHLPILSRDDDLEVVTDKDAPAGADA